jgi:hypothetical protein
MRASRGQVLPFVALLVVICAGAALVLARLGGEVLDRARARTAADAAALAGVDGGRTAAVEAARANGGVLERFVTEAGATEVTVRVGGSQAVARARRGPPSRAPNASGPTGGETLRSISLSGAIAQSVRAHP